MTSNNALADWLRLTLVPGIGSASQRQLLAAFGLPEQIFAAGYASLARAVGDKLAGQLLDYDSRETIAASLEWAKQPGNHIVTLADPEYPQLLLEIADPPSVLYVKGQVALLNRPALAIVGSRHATTQGLRDAEAFAQALAQAGLTIVSGLALGIDAAAHRGALAAQGSTLAVIGTGADRIYPARNRELALAIVEHGAVISEFPLGTPALAANFPRRNRLIAGLSKGCLVVEAAPASGSLITARLAGEQGREVMAMPGSIHATLSKGCHQLIKQGAKLVECAQDVLDELRMQVPSTSPAKPQIELPIAEEEGDSALVLQALGHTPCDTDTLAIRSGLTAEALCAILTTLELAGKIAGLPGGRYQRLD